MSFSPNQNHDLAGALPQLPILKTNRKIKKGPLMRVPSDAHRQSQTVTDRSGFSMQVEGHAVQASAQGVKRLVEAMLQRDSEPH